MQEKNWVERNIWVIIMMLTALMISAVAHDISWQIMAQKIANYTQTLQDENKELKKQLEKLEGVVAQRESNTLAE